MGGSTLKLRCPCLLLEVAVGPFLCFDGFEGTVQRKQLAGGLTNLEKQRNGHEVNPPYPMTLRPESIIPQAARIQLFALQPASLLRTSSPGS